ncbi:MAG: class I SAM-dependent methyltransferase [Candidatus Kuenenia sp.]|nr:class I SAM-dependent methyltransferase [Candidatus Kuenenia hertensis]
MRGKRTRGLHLCVAVLGIVFLCFEIYAQNTLQLKRPGKLFSPSKIPLLEAPDRDAWQKPELILDALEIEKGQIIADIGAGSGYLTTKLLKRTGPAGIVYAVDIQQEMLDHIKNRLSTSDAEIVRLVLGNMDDPLLPENTIDTAILLSTYHEIAHPVDFMKKVKSSLKPGGRIAIIEFGKESPIGPPLNVRLPEELVINELKQAGFVLQRKYTFLLPYQYFLMFTSY